MTKDELKAVIQDVFPKGEDGQPTTQVQAIADGIATAVDDYVSGQLETLKAWLIQPGAFVINSGSSNVSPGSITNYAPGTTPSS
jgi:hypothetical protein